jgi:hypothetical protein
VKHAFTILHDAGNSDFWLGELNADRTMCRCMLGWNGLAPAKGADGWFAQELESNETIIPEGHPEYDWCCAQLAKAALS